MKNRYEFGMEMLKKVDGHAGEAVVTPLGRFREHSRGMVRRYLRPRRVNSKGTRNRNDSHADGAEQGDAIEGTYRGRIQRRADSAGNGGGYHSIGSLWGIPDGH
ncbi:hypothetical protein QFZ78_000794 [Paenibacillus sp. V4I5]|nr:hypothetical protein [Paenibacillus sp. V4I5]